MLNKIYFPKALYDIYCLVVLNYFY